MPDNQLPDARRQAETDQKDDDPLAELARIVGFDEDEGKTDKKDVTAGDTDPGLDLEAELLRELEIDVAADVESLDGQPPLQQPPLPEQLTPEQLLPEPPLSEPVDAFETDSAPRTVNPDIFNSMSDATPEPVQEPTASPEISPPEPDFSSFKPVGGAQEGPVEQAGNIAENPWPAASRKSVGSSATSLEDELQAAFSALEESGSGPAVPEISEPVGLPPEEFTNPAEPISESHEMASAYQAFEKNIEAAMPEVTPLAEPEDDVSDLLLAEMVDVEAEAAEAGALPPVVPFDASSIADTDDTPEAMADLDLPEFELEEIVPAPPTDTDFGLPLEEELEALVSEASAASSDLGQGSDFAFSDRPDDTIDAEIEALEGQLGSAAELDVPSVDDEEYDDTYVEFDNSVIGDDAEFGMDDDLLVPEYDGVSDAEGDQSSRKGLVAALVVLGIAVAGGAGFYVWNNNLGSQAGGDAPVVIAADSEPVKIKPEDPGGKTVPNQDLAVYDKVAGTESAAPAQQNLVNTTEEPVDVVQRTLDPDTLPLEGRTDGAAESLVKSEDRLAAADGADTGSSGIGSETNGVSPRKVRTLVVKPDGTIVARETPVTIQPSTDAGDATAANSGTTATNLNSTTVVGGSGTADTSGTVVLAPASNTAATAAPESGTTMAKVTESSGAATTVVGDGEASLPPIDENLRNSGSVPVPASKPGGSQSDGTQVVASANSGANVTQTAVSAPVPSSRPAEQPVNIVEAVNERGNLAGSTPTNNPGGYVVQISSQPSEAGAQKSYKDLSRKYASIIGGKGVSIQRADIANRGIFYRVRIPAGSKTNATNLCNRYKAAGGSCFVAR
jgi:hypothetical protein